MLLSFFFHCARYHRTLHSFPTRRSSDLVLRRADIWNIECEQSMSSDFQTACRESMTARVSVFSPIIPRQCFALRSPATRSEEHTSELQSHHDLVCRLLLEKKKNIQHTNI